MQIAGESKNVTAKITSPQPIVNTLKKDNGQRKVKQIAKAFTDAVDEIDGPRV